MTLKVCASCGAPIDSAHIYVGDVQETKYAEKSIAELYTAWINNWKIVRTGMQELVGDGPMPDPREIAQQLAEMPEEVWAGLFENESASAGIRKQMDIQKLVAEIQLENVQIMAAALQHGDAS